MTKKIQTLTIGETALDLSNYAKKTDIKHLGISVGSSTIWKTLPLSVYESSSNSVTYISKPLIKDSIIHICFKIPTAVNNTIVQITQRKTDNTHMRVIEHIPLSQYTRNYISTNIPVSKDFILGITMPIPSGSQLSDIEVNGNNTKNFILQTTIFGEL